MHVSHAVQAPGVGGGVYDEYEEYKREVHEGCVPSAEAMACHKQAITMNLEKATLNNSGKIYPKNQTEQPRAAFWLAGLSAGRRACGYTLRAVDTR